MSTRTINLRGKRRLVAGFLAVLGFTTVATHLAVIVLPPPPLGTTALL